MSKRVLFLCYHGIGHINPCLPLARQLEQQGHYVVLASVAYFRKHVTGAGFNHYTLGTVPFGLNFEHWTINQRGKRFKYWANLRARFSDVLYHERHQELRSLVDTVRPDVILFDATQSTDYIVLYRVMNERRIAHAMFHAMFPTHVLPGRPPANSSLLPGDRAKERSALRRMTWQLNKTDLRQRLLFFGMSDRYLIRRRLKKNAIPHMDRKQPPSLFDFQPQGVPAFILAPREFDFPDFEVPAGHHYVGFISHDAAVPHDPGRAELKVFVRKQKAAGRRLIYCSFGTVEPVDERAVNIFLMRLADTVSGLGHALVISAGANRTPPSGLETQNVIVLPSVPQRELLQQADAFVTHGGLSSIKEAIEAVVPMLMVTVHRQFDPPGNAARVVYHGMGIRGDLDTGNEALKQQLTRLLLDEQYRRNLLKMKEMNLKYADRFVSLVDALQMLNGL